MPGVSTEASLPGLPFRRKQATAGLDGMTDSVHPSNQIEFSLRNGSSAKYCRTADSGVEAGWKRAGTKIDLVRRLDQIMA